MTLFIVTVTVHKCVWGCMVFVARQHAHIVKRFDILVETLFYTVSTKSRPKVFFDYNFKNCYMISMKFCTWH